MSETSPSRWLRIKQPPGLTVTRNKAGNEITIQQHWFNAGYTLTGVGGLLMLLFMICMITSLFNDLGLGGLFVGMSLLIIPLGLLAIAGVGMVNSTIIRLTRTGLSIDHGPIPWSGGQKLETQQIEQLYVTKTTHESKNTAAYRYHLWAKLKDDPTDRALLSRLDQPRQAQYLEQIIEEFLQIEDRPIKREWNVKKVTQIGFELAEALGLTLSAGHDYLAVRGHRDDTKIDFAIRSLYHDPNTKVSVTSQSSPQATTITAQDVKKLVDVRQRGVSLKGQLQLQQLKKGFLYEENGIMTAYSAKALVGLMADLVAAQPGIIATGGELVPPLYDIYTQKNHFLRPVAEDWLRQIADDTTEQLSWRTEAFICADCLTYLDAFSIKLGLLDSATYYGCRVCGQSRRLIETLSGVEAVLDRRWTENYRQIDDGVQVNWLTHQDLFDFDRVTILDADDEAVERFVVKVGNDTDPLRRPRYPEMVCLVACDLSPSTHRILERTFGKVKQSGSR